MRRSLSDPLLRVTPAMWLLACAGDPSAKAPDPTPESPTEPPAETTECASTAPDGADGWSEAELEAFYTTEVHPLLVRELADGGCADCHVPGSTHAVVIWSDDPARTFQSFWSAGRLDVDAARGLVAVVAPDAPTRMPLGGPAWSDEERLAVEQLACAIEQSGQEPTPACSDPVDPGHTPLRRLANWQYGQTVAATTGHTAAVADTLAPDDLAHGFDAVGAAQSFAPTTWSATWAPQRRSRPRPSTSRCPSTCLPKPSCCRALRTPATPWSRAGAGVAHKTTVTGASSESAPGSTCRCFPSNTLAPTP